MFQSTATAQLALDMVLDMADAQSVAADMRGVDAGPVTRRTMDHDAALRAYDSGVPSTLPDSNQYKSNVEQHRWGAHHRTAVFSCPVCAREVRAETAAHLGWYIVNEAGDTLAGPYADAWKVTRANIMRDSRVDGRTRCEYRS